MKTKVLLIIIGLILSVSLVAAQENPAEGTEVRETTKVKKAEKDEGKVSVVVFSFWKVKLNKKKDNPSEFDINRVYLNYKRKINADFSGRVTLDVGRVDEIISISIDTEADTNGNVTDVKAKTKNDHRLEAYLKYAYIEWKLLPKTTLKLGLHGLYQFKVQEDFWGYRYIEKSYMDLNKYGPSSDLGLTLNIKPMKILAINLTFVNGEGYKKPQLDNTYKAGIGLGINPIKLIQAYLYFDNYGPIAGVSQQTIATFLGVKLRIIRIGVEYNIQNNHKNSKGNDVKGLSAYTTVSLLKPLEVLFRFDQVDQGKDSYSYIIVGLQYTPVKGIKTSLNLRNVTLDAGDAEQQLVFNSLFKF